MTEPANKIASIVARATRGEVYVVQLRDTADGSIKFTVGYSSAGTEWCGHRFDDVGLADASCIVLASWLRCEVRRRTFYHSIYADSVDSALRTIMRAEVGRETVVFAQCCRDGIAAALRGGMDKGLHCRPVPQRWGCRSRSRFHSRLPCRCGADCRTKG